ncbi:hypothetical protein AB5V95_00655 [Metamycoplasma spumans]|uniref:hypothetical protein n=1 Tax=Metamycoplasma spumans TaxID=92406 RepID=UPI0034DD3CE7
MKKHLSKILFCSVCAFSPILLQSCINKPIQNINDDKNIKKEENDKNNKQEEKQELGPGALLKREYLVDPSLYKNAQKENKIVIEKPFVKLVFKTENKSDELLNFLKTIKNEDYYIIPIHFTFTNYNNLTEQQLIKELPIFLKDRKDLTLMYIDKEFAINIKDFNFKKFFITPFKEIENFKIPFSNVDYISLKNDYENIFQLMNEHVVSSPIIYEYKTNKIKNKDGIDVDVIDNIMIRIFNDKDSAEIKLFAYRYYPVSLGEELEWYIKEYNIDGFQRNVFPFFKLEY